MSMYIFLFKISRIHFILNFDAAAKVPAKNLHNDFADFGREVKQIAAAEIHATISLVKLDAPQIPAAEIHATISLVKRDAQQIPAAEIYATILLKSATFATRLSIDLSRARRFLRMSGFSSITITESK